jgi:hypothetical protein
VTVYLYEKDRNLLAEVVLAGSIVNGQSDSRYEITTASNKRAWISSMTALRQTGEVETIVYTSNGKSLRLLVEAERRVTDPQAPRRIQRVRINGNEWKPEEARSNDLKALLKAEEEKLADTEETVLLIRTVNELQNLFGRGALQGSTKPAYRYGCMIPASFESAVARAYDWPFRCRSSCVLMRLCQTFVFARGAMMASFSSASASGSSSMSASLTVRGLVVSGPEGRE